MPENHRNPLDLFSGVPFEYENLSGSTPFLHLLLRRPGSYSGILTLNLSSPFGLSCEHCQLLFSLILPQLHYGHQALLRSPELPAHRVENPRTPSSDFATQKFQGAPRVTSEDHFLRWATGDFGSRHSILSLRRLLVSAELGALEQASQDLISVPRPGRDCAL